MHADEGDLQDIRCVGPRGHTHLDLQMVERAGLESCRPHNRFALQAHQPSPSTKSPVAKTPRT